MQIGILPKLTKDYILTKISQEQIMEKYLDIPVQITNQILSPFRKESRPSCGFYYNEHGRLRIRDLGGDFWGDCFDVVAWKLKVNSKDKKAFQLILHTIAKDFRIHKYIDNKEVVNYEVITSSFFKNKTKKPKLIIRIIPRKINYHDIEYWKKFNINETLLKVGKVYFAQEIYISRDNMNFIKVYTYSTKDPAYCYYGGRVNYIEDWKVYYPFRDKSQQRFLTNSSFLQGKHLITCGRIGIITKAYKDVLAFRSFGLQAVAPTAESVLLTKEDYWFMKTKFDYLVSCMDYDREGKRMAIKLRKTYGITPFMFTNGAFGTKNYTVKDFAEYVNSFGVNDTNNLLHNLFNNYLEDFQNLDNYYFNSLKFIK